MTYSPISSLSREELIDTANRAARRAAASYALACSARECGNAAGYRAAMSSHRGWAREAIAARVYLLTA